jgi:hypothetical protein
MVDRTVCNGCTTVRSPLTDASASVSARRNRSLADGRRTVLQQIKSVEVAKLPRLNDRKIKAPPTVALIVVVGVEVKGASHELPGGVFPERLANQYSQSQQVS